MFRQLDFFIKHLHVHLLHIVHHLLPSISSVKGVLHLHIFNILILQVLKNRVPNIFKGKSDFCKDTMISFGEI